MKILFCDINKTFIDACKVQKELYRDKITEIEMYHGDISTLELKNAAYLSPGNGFGTMSSGINHVFATKMFPGIHKIVMTKISKLNTKTKQTRCIETFQGEIEEFDDIVPYLPVGNVIVTDLSIYPR
jgi:hypothetical protein